jgi:hypothetical protein
MCTAQLTHGPVFGNLIILILNCGLVMLYSDVVGYQHFGGLCCLYLQGNNIMSLYLFVQRHIKSICNIK